MFYYWTQWTLIAYYAIINLEINIIIFIYLELSIVVENKFITCWIITLFKKKINSTTKVLIYIYIISISNFQSHNAVKFISWF